MGEHEDELDGEVLVPTRREREASSPLSFPPPALRQALGLELVETAPFPKGSEHDTENVISRGCKPLCTARQRTMNRRGMHRAEARTSNRGALMA